MKRQNQIQMKQFGSIIVLFISVLGSAQNYKGENTNVKQDGLHQIQLSPEVRAAANENLSFFRILDAKKMEVPYVVSNFNGEATKYNTFKIISKESIKDSITSFKNF